MRQLILSLLLIPLLCMEVYAAPKVATWYDSSSRIVYAITDGASPTVYFAGEYFGNCIGKSEVHSMNFLPSTKFDSSFEAELKASAKAKGLKVSGFANSKQSISYRYPAVYYYNFNGLTKNLHFNVIAKKDNIYGSSGWNPDASGGCTYKIPSITIDNFYNRNSYFRRYFGKKVGNNYSCHRSFICQNFSQRNRKIAFRESDGKLFYYNGRAWRKAS